MADKAHSIVQRTITDSIEDVLKEVGKEFFGKGFGWEEAILSGLFYRFPSEVKKQFFCSERALEDFLLAHTLGFNAQYIEIFNYNGSGMHHEMVLVPSNDRLYALDWGSVSPITITTNALLIEGTQDALVTFNDMKLLPSEYVAPRVNDLRSAETFLSAIQMGQHLYRRDSEFAQVDGLVKFCHKRGREGLLFKYDIMPKTSSLRSYFADYTFLNPSGSIKYQELGILRSRTGFTHDVVPILGVYEIEGRTRWEHFPFYEKLTESERIEVCLHLAYDAQVRARAIGTGKPLKNCYLFKEDTRMEFLAGLPEWSKQDNSMGRYMGEVLRQGAKLALGNDMRGLHRYLDYVIFSEGLLASNDNAERTSMELAAISDAEYREIAIRMLFTRMLHGVLSQNDNEAAQLSLAKIFHDKTKIPPVRDSNPLHYFTLLSGLEREQSYPVDFGYQK